MIEENLIVVVVSSLVTLLLAWFGLKKHTQDTGSKFQENLLSRIESLEQDNEILRRRNEDLLKANLEERRKQLELEQKIQRMEHERAQMLDRIKDLELKVESLLNSMKQS
jgi:cell division protein FtsB